MGVRADYQAMPEECELMISARHDPEIASMMPFFNMEARNEKLRHLYATNNREYLDRRNSPKAEQFMSKLEKALQDKPDLPDRYYGMGLKGAEYTAQDILESVAETEDEASLGYLVAFGKDILHPEAESDFEIRFVPAKDVPRFCAFLNTITEEIFFEWWHSNDADSEWYEASWRDFVGMREVYRAALEHGEAVIVSRN
jgi:hypothetical protein